MTSSASKPGATGGDATASTSADPRPIRPLLASVAISVSGDGALIAAAPLLAAAITSEPLAVAAVSAAFYLPWFAAGLPAGALADRWPRRRVMVIADLVRCGLLAVLALLVATGTANIPLLIAAVFAAGVAQCFFDAASQAIIPALVGRDRNSLNKVNGRYWALDTAGRALIGPPIGSWTFSITRALPFALDSLSFLASAALVRMLPESRPTNHKKLSLLPSIREGMRHLMHTRDLRVLALAMGTFNYAYWLAMGTFVLYAKAVLGVRDSVYGLLLAAMAVGGITAGANAARLSGRLSFRQVQALAMLVSAAVWAAVALFDNVFATAALFMCYGAAASLASVAVSSARQSHTPDELIGRVVAAFRLIGVGAAGLGALTGGLVADAFTLKATFAAAAAVLIIGAVPTWTRKRADTPT